MRHARLRHTCRWYAQLPSVVVTAADRVKQDVVSAMKAGEKDRVGALRMVLSELQKALKAGDDDEITVLRRERKRRLEAAAAYRDAGRDERAGPRRPRPADRALPAGGAPRCELAARSSPRSPRPAPQGPGDMGKVMLHAMPKLGGRADGKRVSAPSQEALGLDGPRQLDPRQRGRRRARRLRGPVLRELEERLGCELFLRGNVLTLDGDDADVAAGGDDGRRAGRPGRARPRARARPPSTRSPARSPRHESPGRDPRGRRLAPPRDQGRAEDRQPEALRRLDPRHTVTFGIGPAGTGKTFLAVAMAVAALTRREVNRIILTRPAVEAGERLGFLPGDIQAKVDPYLRPLFDALYDMLDPERSPRYLERGVIEVAPLAFMRGRAQPLDRQVLTPDGLPADRELRVGDLVVGSDGRPTPVLGVYPQGRKEVFRVRRRTAPRPCAAGSTSGCHDAG